MSTNGTMKDRLTTGFIRFFEKWTPNSMVFTFLLTIVVGILALLFTPTPLLFTSAEGQLSLVDAWVQGFWNLLTFAMQMALIMITGSVVATAPPVKRALHRLAYVPNSPFSAIMLILLVTGITYWIHWGVGMMFSINLGREILAASREKGYKIHQPAFVALSYSTFAAGIGLSQAAPILGATPGALQDLVVSDAVKAYIPETVPLTQTVLSPINLLHCGLILLVVIVLGWALYPKKDSQIVELSDELYEDIKKSGEAQLSRHKATSPADWINHSPLLNLVIGGFGLFWIIKLMASGGFANISLDNINFILLILGVLLCRDPETFCSCVMQATASVWGVIIQFPFYAGIFGMIAYTGLSDVIVNFFMSFATKGNFPMVAYIYSAILNMAVPSGGSKFAIEAPYILDVCSRLDIDVGKILLAYTFGDQTTNIIQPFWALPFLAMYKLDFKHILPFAFMICIAALIIDCIFTGFYCIQK